MAKWEHMNKGAGGGGAVYGLGLIGSLVYFIQQSVTIPDAIVAFIKAILWPAILVYHLLSYLHV